MLMSSFNHYLCVYKQNNLYRNTQIRIMKNIQNTHLKGIKAYIYLEIPTCNASYQEKIHNDMPLNSTACPMIGPFPIQE